MSEEVVKKLLMVAGPLLGAVVGALISALTTWSLERRRWRHERREKLAALRRDALAAALEWIEPMRNAESRASSLIMAAIQGDIDYEEFLRKFPYLLGDLVKRDLPAGLRAVLPEDTYTRGRAIVRSLNEIQVLGVRYAQESQLKGTMAGFQECSAALDAVGKQINSLETDLREAFHKTFE